MARLQEKSWTTTGHLERISKVQLRYGLRPIEFKSTSAELGTTLWLQNSFYWPINVLITSVKMFSDICLTYFGHSRVSLTPLDTFLIYLHVCRPLPTKKIHLQPDLLTQRHWVILNYGSKGDFVFVFCSSPFPHGWPERVVLKFH